MNLEVLISQIQSLDRTLKHEANKAVNRLLTIRNWLIGYYIVEYEQKGEDRANYGANLLDTLAQEININGLGSRNLKLFKQFFLCYPLIVQTVSAQLMNLILPSVQKEPDKYEQNITGIVQTVSAQFEDIDNQPITIRQTLSDELKNINIGIGQTPSAQSYETQLGENIINNLSFSHITLLLPVDEPIKRIFYAVETIKGTWSVRELKRQINSLITFSFLHFYY